ncbi:MAG TPA: hypothetical protein VM487_11615 [Phycisphaerae bacterium]|nr:hypothetical protein [Phycisphaerae bacterium]
MMKREPNLIIGGIASILALASAFGLDLSADQTAAIAGVGPILATLIARHWVSPASG